MEFLYRESANISDNELAELNELLVDYKAYLIGVAKSGGYEDKESSINLPSDEALLCDVLAVSEAKGGRELKYIVVIGIGGSNLGTKAVYDSLYGNVDQFEPDRFPKLLFADTNDPQWIAKMTDFLVTSVQDPCQFVVNSISKSGGTTETIANTEFIVGALRERFGDAVLERMVVTSDDESPLWKSAKELGITVLSIPKNVGGRFSVFSSVGLFPLALLGLDVKALRKGALTMRERCLNEPIATNPAMLSAAILFSHFKKGKTINDNFIFHPELESLGKWYRQLMGESIGKEKDMDGNIVHTGITPRVSIGSTDLHSVGQLYLGGPQDKTTTFISAKRVPSTTLMPQNRLFPNLIESLHDKSLDQIMRAILEGTKIAYLKNKLPFMEVILEDISEHSLGEFLQFKMIEMMYLGNLMRVNAFDQPNVESYKIATRRILEEEMK